MLDLINPKETILVTCRGDIEILGKSILKDNVMAADWHSPLSFEPQMFGVAIGKTRLSYKIIKKSGVFVINYMRYDDKEKVLFCGRNTGLNINKFEKSGLNKEESDTIDCPRISDAMGFIECKVVEEVETGDHVLFIGEVTKAVKKYDGKKLFHIKEDNFTTTS